MASGRVSKIKGKVVDIPNPPTIGTATAGAESASIAFTAYSGGAGGPTLSYIAKSNPGNITATGSTSPINITGLTAGTSYTISVAGVNPTGTSEYSSASNSAVPTLSTSFESIATVTGNTSQTITFSNIPQTFKHLQIRAISRVSLASYSFSIYSMRVGNGSVDSGSNYSNHRFYTSGNGTVSADGGANGTSIDTTIWTANNSTANNVGVGIIDILDYADTNKYKTVRTLTGFDNNGSGDAGWTANSASGLIFASGNWRSTSAINTISLLVFGSSANSVQHIALYGIKGA